jgi:hypothetical protein
MPLLDIDLTSRLFLLWIGFLLAIYHLLPHLHLLILPHLLYSSFLAIFLDFFRSPLFIPPSLPRSLFFFPRHPFDFLPIPSPRLSLLYHNPRLNKPANHTSHASRDQLSSPPQEFKRSHTLRYVLKHRSSGAIYLVVLLKRNQKKHD